MKADLPCLSLAVLIAGFGPAACGEDDSSPAGASEDSAEGAGSTGTPDPTGEATSDDGMPSGPGTTGETGTPGSDDSSSGPTNDDESGGTTTGASAETTYFRITSLDIRDPHLFVLLLGDVTVDINDSINEGLVTDDPNEPDGMLDLGFVVAFDPLEQSDGSEGAYVLVNAQCSAPVDSTSCDLLPNTDVYETDYSVIGDGECYAADPSNLSAYDSAPAPPTPTNGPCFTSAATDVLIVAGAVALPLSDARMSAQFVGDPAGNLIEGNLEGFISTAAAETTSVSTPLGDFDLIDFLEAEDQDGDGWVFHIAFTAEAVEWTGAQ